MVLGSIWDGGGTLRAVFWQLLEPIWSFFGHSKSYLFKALVQDDLQEVIWMDLGSLWEGFGTVLGRFGEGSGSLLGGFGKRFGRLSKGFGGGLG